MAGIPFWKSIRAVWANITLIPPLSSPPFIQRSTQVSPLRSSAGDGWSWFHALDAPNKRYKNTARTTTSMNASWSRVRGAKLAERTANEHNFIWLGITSVPRFVLPRLSLEKRPIATFSRGKSSLSLSELVSSKYEAVYIPKRK